MHALARDNLELGVDIVADCVNPWMLTRDAWRETGTGAGATVTEIEVMCSNAVEHRRRVEGRASDIPGMRQIGWWIRLIEAWRNASSRSSTR